MKLSEKKIVIMGAGIRGKRVLRYCRNKGYEVLAFIDNSSDKWGSEIDGLACLPVDTFVERDKEIVVIVTPEHCEELERSIRDKYSQVIGETAVTMIGSLPESADYDKLFSLGHFYNLYPDVRAVREKAGILYNVQKDILGIDFNLEGQKSQLERMREMYCNIPDWSCPSYPVGRYRAAYGNDSFSPGDMIGLCAMLQVIRPKRLIEVGSGWSSAVTLDTNEYLLNNSIKCSFIEPYPERLNALLKSTDQIELRIQGLEEVELEYFDQLEAGDILFIDSSHVSKMGSDVNYLFFEIFPRLKNGVYVHLHDIFSSFEYPMHWIEQGMVWNELYLLRSFLQYNQQWEIIFFQNMMEKKYPEMFWENWPVKRSIHGGSFWMRKK